MTLRDRILLLLEKNKGKFISGQEIAENAGVSRSAVAKCVAMLKSEGFQIRSVNNQGHCLELDSDILSESGIRANLEDEGVEIEVFESIDSTNSEAKRRIAQGLDSDAIFASETQTAGRGRRGKSFYSPSSSGIYFSAVLHPEVGLADSTAMTSAAAVAVCEALSCITNKRPAIKWVNDIFIDGRKVCGILTEAVSDLESGRVQAVIVGIGLNLTTEDFPEELRSIAGSVGKNADRCALIANIFTRLKNYSVQLPDRKFMDDYRKNSLVIGRDISFTKNGIDYTARGVDIHNDGGLEVITSNGEKMILNSGEISVKL